MKATWIAGVVAAFVIGGVGVQDFAGKSRVRGR